MFIRVALVAFIYLGPVAIAFGRNVLGKTREELPELPRLSSFDPPKANELQYKSLEELRDLLNKRRDIFLQAQAAGVSWKSTGKFDERWKKGKELNPLLLETDSRIKNLKRDISALRADVYASIYDWRSPFDAWRLRLAMQIALRKCWQCYVSAFICAAAFGRAEWSSAIRDVILLDLLPVRFYAPALIASSLTGILFAVLTYLRYHQLSDRIDQDYALGWEALRQKWNPDHLPNLEDIQSEGVERDHADDNERKWFDVLGVSASASLDEIKNAWHAGLKKYHPDNVERLGPKLKSLAETETKDLNAAYEAAMKVKAESQSIAG
jgi:hypothetical protein